MIPRDSSSRSNEWMVGVVSPVATLSVATVATGLACSGPWIIRNEPAILGAPRNCAPSSWNVCVTEGPGSDAHQTTPTFVHARLTPSA